MKQRLRLIKSLNTDIYYNFSKPLSYGKAITWIDVKGGRGIGKTTGSLILSGNWFNKYGSEFVYIRRYKPELQKFVRKDTLKDVMPDITYKGDGNGGYTVINSDDVVGHLIPLSTGIQYKSVQFPNVKLIIYDESSLPKGNTHYIPDEVTALMELISSIVRTRTDYKIITLSNNVDLFAPINRFYNIPLFEDYYIDKKRGLFFEHPKNNPKLLELEKQTPLYRLTQGTAYHDYHYNNKYIKGYTERIGTPPITKSLLCRIVMNNETTNVYTYIEPNKGVNIYFETKQKKIMDNITYIIEEDGKANYFYIDLFRKKIKPFLSKIYYNNLYLCDNERTTAIIAWIMENI